MMFPNVLIVHVKELDSKHSVVKRTLEAAFKGVYDFSSALAGAILALGLERLVSAPSSSNWFSFSILAMVLIVFLVYINYVKNGKSA